jgi:hypothetical protein
MRFAISIGCHELVHFIHLNVTYARRIFGDAPICLYDSPSAHNAEIKAIAEEHGCAYFCEAVNRSHFAGDIQSAITAIAFAQQHGCDLALKINQRTILLAPDAPQRLGEVFADPNVILANAGVVPAETILCEGSRFHSRFPANPDFLVFRASAWDAAGVAERYHRQWTSLDANKYSAYSEVFWANEIKHIGPEAHRTLDWMTRHTAGKPFSYLRKIQNTEEHYKAAAVAAGLEPAEFPTQEWQNLKPGYSPGPRA